MYNQAVAFKDKCVSCKLVWGSIILSLAALNTKRVTLFWTNFTLVQKAANLVILGGLYLVGAVNFRHAYVYKMGQQMQLGQDTLPAKTLAQMSDPEREMYFRHQLQVQEERDEVSQVIA